ncbi:4-oxalocrotonate tautomerase [Bifidobacterium ramosum]|uniref:4-oxalocrotonate tautomerase n=2 Tax=Bifidobacterium ramosum TaxID=1798158 RepID=A0A6L4WXD7_9BIFI|nr:4-oxalocrotonate tautomerase [Bifidobacterium ramosum]NEG72765.1 4-oxalocrotonate tautomerase [Bifidobacterium ramosum]
MPYIRARVAGDGSTEIAAKVADLLTGLAVDVLGKQRDVVSVDVDFADPACWFVGGRSVPDRGEGTFYVEIKITEGTNAKGDKALFVRRAFDGMAAILGTVSEASYIVVQDVRPDSWGFAGLTQEYRYIAGRLAAKTDD